MFFYIVKLAGGVMSFVQHVCRPLWALSPTQNLLAPAPLVFAQFSMALYRLGKPQGRHLEVPWLTSRGVRTVCISNGNVGSVCCHLYHMIS
jgi:hypothetical protein